MAAYTVLARKYRPQTFADLVGQEHVSRTIGNAIESGRVAHAFLFTGARGVGKTTTARLLAKSLNCEKGPTPEPCNQCDMCREIAAGSDIDVLEIDGASNNSVDDVRRLQESLPYRPVRDRYKVVIVDEVHMLSTGAFNAFLKTLEEPPAHVKFIFATTESHKVPVTIRSRCQRHDFRLIRHSVVAARVREILSREGIEADDAAVSIVAREAAGSMRDALTVLDQLLAFGGGNLVGEQVARGLGIADRKNVMGVANAVLSGDAGSCVRTIAALAEQGLDMLHFARQLVSLMRDLVVLRVVGDDHELVELVDDERAEAQTIASSCAPVHLERTFAGIAKLVDEVGQTASPQLVLEMGLVRLAHRPALEPLAELLARLAQLEARIGGGTAPSGPRGPGPSGGGGSGGGPGGFSGGGSGGARKPFNAPGNAPSGPPTRRADAFAPPQSITSAQPQAVSSAAVARSIEPQVADAALTTAVGVRAPLEVVQNESARLAPANAEPAKSEPARAEPARVAPASVRPESTRPASTRPASTRPANGNGHVAPASVPPAWKQVVEALHESQPALCAVLEHGTAIIVEPTRIVVSFPDSSFFGRQAAAPAAQAILADTAERVLGQRPVIEIGFGLVQGAPTLASEATAQRAERRAKLIEIALNHPRVREAMEVFPESEGQVDVHVDPE